MRDPRQTSQRLDWTPRPSALKDASDRYRALRLAVDSDLAYPERTGRKSKSSETGLRDRGVR